MGRPARLTIGGLLLGIAGLLFASRDQAAEREIITILVAVFAVPGTVAFAWGLLPPLGGPAADRTTMVFLPARLAGGLLLSVAGVLVLYLYYEVVHVAPKMLLIAALLAVPGGLLIAGGCWTEACRVCGVALEEYRSKFNAETGGMLEAAVASGGVDEIVGLHAAAPGPRRIDVLIRYCPRCRRIGQLEGPGKTRATLAGEQVTTLLTGVFGSRQPDEREGDAGS